MNDRQLKELNRLRKIYPLFTFDEETKESVNNLIIGISSGHKFYCSLEEGGKLGREAESHLEHDHMEKSIRHEFMKRYPDLVVSPYANRNGIMLSIWVKRGERDAESIGSLDMLNPTLTETLDNLQLEAHSAKQEGMFFCSGHKRAEPKKDGWYFHFAGNYCKEYGDEHPEQRKEAAREIYR